MLEMHNKTSALILISCRYLLLRHYSKPVKYDEHLAQSFCAVLPYALIIHTIASILAYGNGLILPAVSIFFMVLLLKLVQCLLFSEPIQHWLYWTRCSPIDKSLPLPTFTLYPIVEHVIVYVDSNSVQPWHLRKHLFRNKQKMSTLTMVFASQTSQLKFMSMGTSAMNRILLNLATHVQVFGAWI